jgi:GNAT superfamily N-acetyltransferase
LHFDAAYAEELELKDGTRVRIRLLRPDDKERLKHGFELMSPRSRFLRFFTHKESLTDEELHYLCDIDQVKHFALAAGQLDADGNETEGLAVARFICFADEPESAEAAIAVVDGAQGKGLGKLLFERLVAAAVERGVKKFRAEYLVDNARMQSLLDEIAPEMHAFPIDGEVMKAEFPLPETTSRENPLYRMMVAAAKGLFQWKPSKR